MKNHMGVSNSSALTCNLMQGTPAFNWLSLIGEGRSGEQNWSGGLEVWRCGGSDGLRAGPNATNRSQLAPWSHWIQRAR